jgi:hypothetical protein
MRNNSYISGVNGIIHYLDPAFECSYLEETEVSFPHMIKIHWRVFPSIVFSNAGITVWNNLIAQSCTVGIYALQKRNVLQIVVKNISSITTDFIKMG